MTFRQGGGREGERERGREGEREGGGRREEGGGRREEGGGRGKRESHLVTFGRAKIWAADAWLGEMSTPKLAPAMHLMFILHSLYQVDVHNYRCVSFSTPSKMPLRVAAKSCSSRLVKSALKFFVVKWLLIFLQRIAGLLKPQDFGHAGG